MFDLTRKYRKDTYRFSWVVFAMLFDASSAILDYWSQVRLGSVATSRHACAKEVTNEAGNVPNVSDTTFFFEAGLVIKLTVSEMRGKGSVYLQLSWR